MVHPEIRFIVNYYCLLLIFLYISLKLGKTKKKLGKKKVTRNALILGTLEHPASDLHTLFYYYKNNEAEI